jgi:predicted flavoprotein YhiN
LRFPRAVGPFRNRRAGAPLKRIAVTFGERTVRGEAVITTDGLEGGAIYALSARLREAIAVRGEAVLAIDLRPDLAETDLAAHIVRGRKKESLSTSLRKTAKLSPAAIDLLREAAAHDSVRLGDLPPPELARPIKAVPVRVTGTAPIARAISTAGGVSFAEIDCNFMLRRLPGVFVAGEMLDWEAPTGGYLLQASFATGIAAAAGAVAWMARKDSASR